MSAGLGRRWGGAIAIAAALLLVAPVHALAGDSYPVSGGSLIFGAVRGSHGYRINFSEWDRGHGPHFKVRVEGHHARVFYGAPAGRVPADGVAASLGRRGRFDLRLASMGRKRTLGIAHSCEGRRGTWQRGYLVGSAGFHGERDYTEARVRRIPIVAESWPAFRCHYLEGGGRRANSRRAQVTARRGPVGFGAVLSARSGPVDRRALFRAWTSDHSGRVQIYREVSVPAPESSFAFPGGPKLPEEVTVEPPQPFAGSASFTRTPESTFSWSGDLTVTFPGLPPIRLAGPSFEAGVCALDACVRQEPDRPEREPPA